MNLVGIVCQATRTFILVIVSINIIDIIRDVSSLTYYGRLTNISHILYERIWWMHNGTLKNKLPDMEIGTRRKQGADVNKDYDDLKNNDIIIFGFKNGELVQVEGTDNETDYQKINTTFLKLRELMHNRTNVNKTDTENEEDYQELLGDNILGMGINNGKLVERRNNELILNPDIEFARNDRKTRHESQNPVMINPKIDERKTTHQLKLNAITEFLKDKAITTDYIYDEVERIHNTGTLKDSLRYMVTVLERPKNAEWKAHVLQCYKDIIQKKEIVSGDMWRIKPNNLKIHSVLNPSNDGE